MGCNNAEIDHSIDTVKLMAHSFWQSLAADERISDELRSYSDRAIPITLGRANN